MAWRFVKQPDGKLARWSDVPTDQTKPALPTLAEIEAMEALLRKATPGPWTWSDETLDEDESEAGTGDQWLPFVPQGAQLGNTLIQLADTYDRSREDCAMVAVLLNAAPSLLAAAREAVRLREENAMLRAALAAKHRCDTPDCPNDSVVGLCWDHGLTPLDGATATLKVCLEAECVERQKAEDERDALREELRAANGEKGVTK